MDDPYKLVTHSLCWMLEQASIFVDVIGFIFSVIGKHGSCCNMRFVAREPSQCRVTACLRLLFWICDCASSTSCIAGYQSVLKSMLVEPREQIQKVQEIFRANTKSRTSFSEVQPPNLTIFLLFIEYPN